MLSIPGGGNGVKPLPGTRLGQPLPRLGLAKEH
jgi:hypothetical protein